MKKLFSFLFLIIFLHNGYPQNRNNEFRSMWVVTWEYISTASKETNQARIRTILDNLVKANMNAVLWQVRQGGTAYYYSSHEPWGSYIGGTDPGWDPLQYAIEEAHKRGLELHAWFNVFASGSTASGTPAREHPEWICRDASGNPMTANIALSPGMPEVRAYLNTVAMEIIRNYDIDGFHLDYIRWNEYYGSSNLEKAGEQNQLDGVFTNEKLNEIMENQATRYLYDVQHPYSAGIPAGFTTWDDWWRHSVTEFVRVLQDSIKSEKPWVKLSCAALGNYNWGGWNGYNTVYQDAALWFNEGYVDQIAGMHYHWTTGSGFIGMLSQWQPYLIKGINAGRLYTVGPPSYILQEQNIWWNHPGIVEAIRTVHWADGFQFFSYASWRDYNYFTEAAEVFIKSKKKVRSTLSSGENVAAPQIQIQKVNELNYKLTVTPAGISKPYWFAVYRSKNNQFSKDTTEIVSINFSDAPFSVDQVFNGLQDYNGEYTYSATMLNRYWEESGFSNTVVTDPLPSSAPTIVSTNPVEGAVVPLKNKIEVNFSKSIDTNNILSNISLTPEVPFTNVTATSKKITITTAGFEYSTDYTFKVESTLKDVNGRLLDGNNDGTEGDPFYLHFSSEGQDTIGPVLLSTTPQENDSVDIQSVVSFYFNENLNAASVAANVVLFRNGIQVQCEARVTNYEDGAVVNIRPNLTQGAQYQCILKKEITDLLGNQMTTDYTFNFTSKYLGYYSITSIDNFSNTGWEQPNFSGSTTGIDVTGTSWAYTGSVYIPQVLPRRSAVLNYKWQPDATAYLIREYLSGGIPRSVTFDKSNILQVYINGDGSGSLFRIALDEDYGSGTYSTHEVSTWVPINWRGWKLFEWDLSDPTSVGTWIGNDLLDGTSYRIDSFQLTKTDNSAASGSIYFDELRFVKKDYVILSSDKQNDMPMSFNLYQNYPNPFNPSTIIPFNLDKSGKVTLDVYDILGRKVKNLVSEELNAGYHKINFDASDLSSGQYIYRLTAGERQLSKLMILIK